MGDLLVRNIPEDLRRGLTNIASSSGQSLSETAKNTIRLGLAQQAKAMHVAKQNAYEAIRAAISSDLPTETEYAEFEKALLESRKSSVPRTVPDFE